MSPVEDIILNKQIPTKKRGKGVLIVIFILLFILLGLCGFYWYYVNYIQITPKASFFKYVGQTNVDKILNSDIYYTMFEKMEAQSFKTESEANFTTTKENDFTKAVDVSKMKLTLNTSSDLDNEATFIDAKLTYSDNDFFDLKLLSDKNSIGIASSEILDKYLATSKNELSNSLNKTTGVDTDISSQDIDNAISNLNLNKINLTEEYENAKANEYMNLILEKVPEEAVTENENVVVTLDSQTINSKAYTLSLNKENYKDILTTILTSLKNDEELLGKIVTGESKDEKAETTQESDNNNTISEVRGDLEEHQTAEQYNAEENLEVLQEPTNDALLETGENSVQNKIEPINEGNEIPEENEEKEEENLFSDLVMALVTKQKINTTVKDLQDRIDTELANVKKLNEGMKVTVYVSNEEDKEPKTIKLVVELPNTVSVDIEYPTDNKIKVTYLENKEVEDEEGNVEKKSVGTSTQIERKDSELQTKFKILLNDIENKKVIAKTDIDLTTEGSETSNKYTNNIIIKYNDNEGDVKVNITNNIDFENTEITEMLNDENAIFVDKLSDEEFSTLFMEIVMKCMQLYSDKILNLDFIDNSSSNPIIEQPTDMQNPSNDNEENLSKEDAKNLLISTVEQMMNEANERGEEFTIKNLEKLEIDNRQVSTIITEDLATVKVEGYTFYIDKDFMLTE